MPRKIGDAAPPRRGLLRLLFRIPVWLYRAGLGGLLGHRFMLVTHRGRVTGRTRRTALEVVGREYGGYLAASGFGPRAQWYQNIRHDPHVTVQIGWRRAPATARLLTAEESADAMVRYARRHPAAATRLMRLCGYQVDGSDADFYTMGHDHIPFVALIPQQH